MRRDGLVRLPRIVAAYSLLIGLAVVVVATTAQGSFVRMSGERTPEGLPVKSVCVESSSFQVLIGNEIYRIVSLASCADAKVASRFSFAVRVDQQRAPKNWQQILRIDVGNPCTTGIVYVLFDQDRLEIAKLIGLEMSYAPTHYPWVTTENAIILTRANIFTLEQALQSVGLLNGFKNFMVERIVGSGGSYGPDIQLLDLKFYGEGDNLDYPRAIHILRFEKGRLVDVSPKFEKRIFDYTDGKFPYSVEWIRDPNEEKGPSALNYIASRLLAYGAVGKWDEGLQEFYSLLSVEGWFDREWVMERAEYLQQRFIAEGRDRTLTVNFDIRDYRPLQDSTAMRVEEPEA